MQCTGSLNWPSVSGLLCNEDRELETFIGNSDSRGAPGETGSARRDIVKYFPVMFIDYDRRNETNPIAQMVFDKDF